MPADHPLSEQEFRDVYRRVPRLTVEVVVVAADGVLLTRRAAGPCRGLWHLPGGTVRFGEPAVDAVRRVARTEVGLTVDACTLMGYVEYPSHYRNGLDSPVGLAFRATEWTGDVRLDEGATAHGWFRELPAQLHDEQRDFLRSAGLGLT